MAPGGYPRRFGSYVLLKPLARGGMGELDLAVTGGRGMEKLCVIKRVLPHLLAAENVQRFREEAMVVVRLSHGNLVGVLDAGREEGQFYLAMDFVEGKDLLATWNQCAVRRVAFPIEIAAYVIKELARGLGYAHAYRDLHLVHRDTSPANVLLSYTGEVKLTDFGLATSKLKEQRTAPGIIYGKLAYLAPEQARGKPLDGRTDLYAAGILLWEMLTGQQLFPTKLPGAAPPDSGHNSTLDALERLKNPIVKPPSTLAGRVPPELDAIVLRALRLDPADRYQTGEEFRLDLASFLAKHAPETDAATLAAFMSLLWEEQINHERIDRDALMREASALLPENTVSIAVPIADDVPTAIASGRNVRGAADRADDPNAPTGPLPRSVREGRIVRDPNDRRMGNQAGGQIDDARPGRIADPDDGVDPGTGIGDHNPDEDARVGSTIAGRYFLRRLCGEGAMGRVYEGHHVEIGRRVAIKILHSNFRNTPDVVERFRREARAASKIGHPNIVDVTDSGTTPDGAFFFVMEFLDGSDLEQLIARVGALAIDRALLIAAQVCRALAAAHTAGIIHRDLKPANVMLVRHRDEEDFVKVLDFGISKQSELDIDPRGKHVGLTRPDAAVGTPIYMAPEQVTGQPADGRTDVYAVGELLFEMLTGVAAYSGSDVIAVFNKKANEDPVPARSLRPDIPVEVEMMLTKATSRRPVDRHATMTALKDEIMMCLARIDNAPLPPGIPLRMEAGMSRTTPIWHQVPRTIWITGAGVVAGLGMAAVVVLWRTNVDDPLPRSAATLRSPLAAGPAAVAPRPTPTPTPTPTSTSASAPPLATKPPLALTATPAAASSSVAKAIKVPASLSPSSAVLSAPTPTPSRLTQTSVRSAARNRAGTSPKRSAVLGQPSPPSAAGPPPATDALNRGRSAFAKGNFPEAVRLGRAVLTTGDAVGGRMLLGDAFYKMERYVEAVAEYDAALRIAPGHPQARRGRELALRHTQR